MPRSARSYQREIAQLKALLRLIRWRNMNDTAMSGVVILRKDYGR